MEEIKIIELPEKPSIQATNYLIAEDEDGTKRVLAKHFRSLLISSLYFNNVEELKNSVSASLKDGDIVQTLGYHEPGDGGGAIYRITYNPAIVEDGGLVHYLSYSDTLRAEMILEDSVNVHQFGAVGDGVTDDSKAIQAAIDNSTYKIIEFNNNKKYLIRNPITINKNGVIINGNGGILSPLYCNGINIAPSNSEDIPSDITINKLHIDCTKSNNGIFIHKSHKIDIMSCIVSNVTSYGINIKSSEFVNINFSKLSGEDTGSLIVVDGSNEGTDSIKYSKFINIVDCDFESFFRAIHVLSNTVGSDNDILSTINIDKCNYHSTVDTAYCIYTSTPVEMISIHANTVSYADTFLYFGGAGGGDIICRDISCTDVINVFNIEASDGALHLDGSIKVNSEANLFANMNAKLHSTVSWDLLPNGAIFSNKPNGQVYDAIHPYNYNEGRGYTVDNTGILFINEVRNLHVDWYGAGLNRDLYEIRNGVKGQLIYLKSSVDLNIRNTSGQFELSEEIISLGKYKGVILRYDGSKWVQIQYKDSTILQTVRREIENIDVNVMVDYEPIQLTPEELIS